MSKIKKILNEPENAVEEALQGLVALTPNSVHRLDDAPVLVKNRIPDGKVGLLVGGGSGHEPLFGGFVGENLADAAVSGNFFAAPTPDVILAAIKAVDRGNGVLMVYGNYAGDNMNFDIAAELAAEEGIRTQTVRVRDDIATADAEERRGIAGDLFVIKIAGAACAASNDLDEAHRITSQARDNTFSLGVALKAGSNPETGKLTFELPADQIEIGMGLHGEPGVARQSLPKADPLVDDMVERILSASGIGSDDDVTVLVNNLGSTTYLELFLINNRLQKTLKQRDIRVYDTQLGTFCTTQEMAGFSISLLKLTDEMKKHYDKQVMSVALKMGGRL
jgi:phosphoenolpyruvate---glycerone phosphotransferase subunit DhaK